MKMKKFINDHFIMLFVAFSLLALTSVTSYWWLSIISVIYFSWNLFYERKAKGLCAFLILLITVLICFNFAVIKPNIKLANESNNEWNKVGYDSTMV